MMKGFSTRLRIKTNPIIKLMSRAVQIASYDVMMITVLRLCIVDLC